MELKSQKRLIIAVLLVVVFACLAGASIMGGILLPNASADEASADLWDGDLIAAGWSDAGTKPAEYVESQGPDGLEIELGSAAALAYFSHEVYADSEHKLDGATVKLTADINLDNKIWIPIGQMDVSETATRRFSGTFDGNGRTIYNLNMGTYFANLVHEDGDNYHIAYPNWYEEEIAIPFEAKDGEEFSYGLFGCASDITIRNLSVKGIDMVPRDYDFTSDVENPATKVLKPSTFGAIIAYSTGAVVMEGCQAGSPETLDKIEATSDNAGVYGGLIGRIYACEKDTGAKPFKNVTISNCKNYVDITFAGDTADVGGIVGFIGDSKGNLEIKDCVNYGNLSGGSRVGGITSMFAGAENINGLDRIVRCDNYGNVLSKDSDFSAGISNVNGSHYTNYYVYSCNNYGNVSGKIFAGGIMGLYYDNGGGVSELLDNYNYGDVYSYGADGTIFNEDADCTSAAGGYIGYCYVGANSGHTGSISYSGGSVGTVYAVATKTDSVIGYLNGESEKRFLIDAGDLEKYNSSDEVPKASEEHVSYVRPSYDDSYNSGIFKYADSARTIIIGLADSVTSVSGGTITIPSTVVQIGYAAFVGHSEITKVVFQGTNLKRIERFAFAGTGINMLDMPKGLKYIGDGAFANCDDLNNVVLPTDASSIEIGKNVFHSTRMLHDSTYAGAFLIAQNSSQFRQLRNDNFSQYFDKLTYQVTLRYILNDGSSALEYRLRGESYSLMRNTDGLWVTSADVEFGPSDTQDYVWFDAEGTQYDISNADELLETFDDIITLHSYSSSEDRVFKARTGIVYDPSRTYTLKELNMLLLPSSDRITEDMHVSIVEYNGETDPAKLPTVIHNAGTYTIQIDYYSPLTITIEKATVDLANLSVLEWRITQIGADASNAQLMSYTLYIYTYDSSAPSDKVGKEYPSRSILDGEQLNLLHLGPSYRTTYVDYSVARNRGAEVTIGIVGEGYSAPVYQLGSNVGEDVGIYQAHATLTVTDNYIFTLSTISSTRGMTITFNEDKTVATVVKDWYIVDISNWIVDSTGADYTIENHTYGQLSYSVGLPAPHYGSSDAITMYLSLNGSPIGDSAGFKVADIGKYINYVMPAGNYSLRIVVAGLEAPDTDGTPVWHNEYTETYTFTVEKATLPSLDSIHNNLQGQSFEFGIEDGRLYGADAATAINTYLSQLANYDRTGTEWDKSTYASYYSSFAITFNLSREGTDEYVTASELGVTSPDDYIVYYKVSADNYYSSIENLGGGKTRYDYYFKLVKFQVVSIPVVNDSALVYTGNRVTPSIETNSLYAIIWNSDDTYVSGGTHSVSFKLYEPTHYHWADSDSDLITVDGDTVTVTYTVAKAENIFTTSLNMLGWNYETFDVAINNIRAAVRYLDEGKAIHFRILKEGSTTAIPGLEDFTVDENGRVSAAVAAILKSLETGEYILYAHVDDTVNYYLEQDPYIEFAVSKAMNSWADGDDDLVLPSWVVGKYDPEVNLIVVNAAHGTVNIIITDIDGNEYYNSVTGVNNLNDCAVGKYLLKAWVDETNNYAALAERTFTIEVFTKVGLPWWGTLLITVGALAIAALIIFILYKSGVFQLMTEKVVVAIRTRANIEATIASVRAAKMMEEGRQSVEDAKRRERLEQARLEAKEKREISPEEREAELEAKAKLEGARAAKLLARSEAILAKAAQAPKTQSVEAPAEEDTDDTPVYSDAEKKPTEE